MVSAATPRYRSSAGGYVGQRHVVYTFDPNGEVLTESDARFGRVVDEVWQTEGQTPTILDEYKYGYDADGNVLWKENAVAHDLTTPVNLDEVYGYNGLNELTSVSRGVTWDTATDQIMSSTQDFSQSWGLDGVGNFSTFDDNGATQDRGVNAANEITSISGGTVTPTYDAAGNMISAPESGAETTRIHYLYDAWNRLVEVRPTIRTTRASRATCSRTIATTG